MLIDFDGKNFKIKTDYYDLSDIKLLPSRHYDAKNKVWTVAPFRRNIEVIRKVFSSANITEKALEAIRNVKEPERTGLKFPIGYPFKTKPMEHQRKALDFIYGNNGSALFLEMGLGKTKVAIDFSSSLFLNKKEINKLLIFCPYSVRKNWVEELEKHMPVPYNLNVLQTSNKKSEKEFQHFLNETRNPESNKLHILIAGIQSIQKGLKKGKAFDLIENFLSFMSPMIIVDESQLIKTHTATRSINVVYLGRYAKRKIIMTGTPLTLSPLDLYMQFQFLDPNILGIGSWYAFRNRYAVLEEVKIKSNTFKKVVGYQNLDELTSIVSKYTFQCRKKDALDLPEKTYQSRTLQMVPEQRKIYNKMKKERLLDLRKKDAHIVANNILASLNYLQQIASGFVMTTNEDGKKETEMLVPLEKNPKIDELLNIVEEAGEQKIIIWTKYRMENKMVSDILKEKYSDIQVVEFHGGLSADQRQENIQRFKKDGRFFVATLQTGAVGLTLNEASLVVYFSNSFHLTDRIQSEDRNHRIGQSNAVTYIDLKIENSVEEKIWEAIQDKKSMSDYISELINKKGLDKALENLLV